LTRLVFILYLFSFLSQNVCAQDKTNSLELDSIIYFRNLSKQSSLALVKRIEFAEKAYKLSLQLGIDTTKVLNNRNLSSLYLESYLVHGDRSDAFKRVNFENLILASKLKDTLVVAIANSNLGYYYDVVQQRIDSAYFFYLKSLNAYTELNDLRAQSSILTSLAIIQNKERDYVGSEENAIKALKLIQELSKTEYNLETQWILYNLLGNISRALLQFNEALEYHKKALETSSEMQDGDSYKLSSINNQAFVYRKLNNTQKALELYKSILKDKDLFDKDPSFYCLVIDNIALTKFEAKESDYDVMEDLFMEAYRISDSIHDKIRQSEVSIDLAKFYQGLDKADKALPFAKQAYQLAKETSYNDLLLESMLLLSQLNPGEEGKRYLNEHVKLSDSLLFKERVARNKYARIAFETDEIEKENERITRERMWLMALSGGLILTLVLLYIIITQRSKNKQLKLEQAQQLANEEIYNLMLSQQDKVEEARVNEKKRISQELHDGILGRLFGTRLSLDSLNFNEGKEAVKTRANYISELKTIEEDIRKISHDLNTDFISGSGFVDIITELIEKQTKAYQLNYDFDHSDHINWEIVPNKTKINIYRIIQECLQNIYKHAEANKVKISFKPKKTVICLSISDDGKGFDIHKSRKGIGLKNINSRVNEIEGKVNFESEINKGTTITIDIPYQLS